MHPEIKERRKGGAEIETITIIFYSTNPESSDVFLSRHSGNRQTCFDEGGSGVQYKEGLFMEPQHYLFGTNL